MTKEDLQTLQDNYNQWCALLPELEKGLEKWQQAAKLLEPLNQFYGSPEWQTLYDSFNEPLDTKGNYSILSEDALWNAFTDQHRLAVEWLKAVTAVIAKA